MPIPTLLAIALGTAMAVPGLKTATVHLRHTSASMVEAGTVLDAKGARGLAPAGIVAWTVDVRRNAVTMVGDEGAVRQFRERLRLLDTRPPQARLTLRLLPDGADALLSVKAEPPDAETTRSYSRGIWAYVDRDQVARCPKQPGEAVTELLVANNGSLHIPWPAESAASGMVATVQPRVNGDGSVTLTITRRLDSMTAAGPSAPDLSVMRRLPPGAGVILLPERPGPALLLQVCGSH